MDKQYPVRQWAHGADLVVSQLEAQGVRQVFGIPGAKIDKVFDSLLDSSIRIIPVRHEANAAFMAAWTSAWCAKRSANWRAWISRVSLSSGRTI